MRRKGAAATEYTAPRKLATYDAAILRTLTFARRESNAGNKCAENLSRVYIKRTAMEGTLLKSYATEQY